MEQPEGFARASAVGSPLTDPFGEAEPEPFRVEICPERDRVRVIPIGEVDLTTAPVLEDCLLELVGVGFAQLRLDLSRVSFLDCAGLRVLVGVWSLARREQVSFEVFRVRGQVARLLALVDLPSGLRDTPDAECNSRDGSASALTRTVRACAQ